MYGTILTPSSARSAVELFHLGVDAAQGFRGVLVLEHEHDAFDRIRIAVLAQDALALLVTERRAAEVPHQDRCPVDLRDDDRADLIQGANETHTADHIALIAARDAPASGVRVVIVDGRHHVRDAEAVVLELLGVEVELVFGGEAAEIDVIDDAGNGFERRNDLPPLNLR